MVISIDGTKMIQSVLSWPKSKSTEYIKLWCPDFMGRGFGGEDPACSLLIGGE